MSSPLGGAGAKRLRGVAGSAKLLERYSVAAVGFLWLANIIIIGSLHRGSPSPPGAAADPSQSPVCGLVTAPPRGELLEGGRGIPRRFAHQEGHAGAQVRAPTGAEAEICTHLYNYITGARKMLSRFPGISGADAKRMILFSDLFIFSFRSFRLFSKRFLIF